MQSFFFFFKIILENVRERGKKGKSQEHKCRRAWQDLLGREETLVRKKHWFVFPGQLCAPGNAKYKY